ncbi:MAG: FAD:protein FMN transferase [Candidatus Omnitrophica bacterium]|nr:FAD:protein FMN transferase [Candidatus Omnitrophota bacterium]
MKNLFIVCGLLIAIFLLPCCAHANDQVFKEYYEVRNYFGTAVSIHAYYDPKIDIASAVRECWQKADQIQYNMNIYDEKNQGDLNRLNKSGLNGVQVSDDVFTIFKHSLEFSRLTGGAFDVTVLPLIKLWKKCAKEGHLPDRKILEQAKAKVGWQNIRLKEPNMVFLMKQGMMVDFGSPSSGYFCDALAKILEQHNIHDFLVDGGGELYYKGKEKGIIPWRVGIEDPFQKDKILAVIELRDRGVSTSGNYEKFVTIEGQKYSHIIDPVSGYPQKDTVSVTVIADTAETANELSTGLCVMGGQKGIALIRSLKNIEALIIENKNGIITRYQTDGFLPN